MVHWLKFGKFADGTSRKQISRVNKIKDKFRWKDDQIEIEKNNNWLIIPKVDMRKKLIQEAHALGHFGPQTTWERLEEDYYWKKLREEVKYWIERCLTC